MSSEFFIESLNKTKLKNEIVQVQYYDLNVEFDPKTSTAYISCNDGNISYKLPDYTVEFENEIDNLILQIKQENELNGNYEKSSEVI